jgi:hypothetical protein
MLVGRLLGEAMNRIGQPSVMGMLLGGIADRYDVTAETLVHADMPDQAILTEAKKPEHNLIIMGVNRRPGDKLFLRPTRPPRCSRRRRRRRYSWRVEAPKARRKSRTHARCRRGAGRYQIRKYPSPARAVIARAKSRASAMRLQMPFVALRSGSERQGCLHK